MRPSQSLPVLPALWALPPTAEGNEAPELGRISAPAPRLPRTHSAGWRVARGGFEERLERIQAQFEPRFPLSKEIRRKHIADVSCGDQLKAKLRLRSGHDLALRRGDAASEGGHSACKPGGDGQSVLLQRELELVETLELAGMHGETSDAGADAAQRLGKVTARALDACVALAPAWLAPVLSQTAGALKALLYSPDHTDDYGAPMLYKTVYLKVAADRMAVDASQLELLTFLLQKSEEKVRQRDDAVAEAKAKVAAAERSQQRMQRRMSEQQAELDAAERERTELEDRVNRLTSDAEGVIEGRLAKLCLQIERLTEEIGRCRRTEQALIEQVEKAVPREEHDAVLLELEELSAAHERLRDERKAVLRLPGPNATGASSDAIELAQLRATHSPRPAWSALRDRADREAVDVPSDVVGGSFGQRRPWLDPNKSTAHNVNALYASYVGARKRIGDYDQVVPNEDAFFRAVGDGPSVPAHLRWPTGQRLRNWRLPKREVEEAVAAFWDYFYSDEHMAAVSARPPGAARLSLPDHLDAFLRQHPPALEFVPPSPEREAAGGQMRSVREYAYNLVDGCKRYRFDADMELFLEVLAGRLPEQTHQRQMSMLTLLQEALEVEDQIEHNGTATGTLSRASVPAVLRKMFPTRTEEQIATLVSTIDDEEGSGVQYQQLFEEDHEGNQSSFIERVRDQWLRAPRDFVNQIEAALCGPNGAGESGLVRRQQAMTAIRACDPSKPEAEAARMVAIGFGDPSYDLFSYDDGSTTDLSVFCQRLLLSFPVRTGKPPSTMPGRREARRSVAGEHVRRQSTRKLAVAAASADDGQKAGAPAKLPSPPIITANPPTPGPAAQAKTEGCGGDAYLVRHDGVNKGTVNWGQPPPPV